jgi:hypothetical protein
MLLGASAALACARLIASTRVGFGDSEALYAAYALHPQAAYLDHPGLVGALARAIGGGAPPGPERAHVVTSVLSTLVPWAMALACRACGAPWRRCFVAALVFALAPEVAIGLFAMTPDLLLVLAWTLGLALAADALRSTPGGGRAACGFSAAGLLAGAAAASKVTGVMLMVGLAVTYASPQARRHARTVAPWAGLAAGAVVLVPVVAFEARLGWPMLHHRLVATQGASGTSWRNLGALVGGQLAYLSPLTAALAVLAGRSAWRDRADAIGRLLLACCLAPLAVLLPLCLWSRVAEPHWLAPAWIALVPAAARAPAGASRRLVVSACALAGAIVAAAYAWVLVPSLLRFAPDSYDPRLDIANELYGWPAVLRAVREEADAAGSATGFAPGEVAVVGPHWVVCAQLEAGLRRNVRDEPPVGCDTPVRDDFDDWWPRDRWRRADVIVWVTDTRFPGIPELPTHAMLRTREVTIARGGRAGRVFTIAVLVRHAEADNLDAQPPAANWRPASRSIARSSSTSGLGVVRSLSP